MFMTVGISRSKEWRDVTRRGVKESEHGVRECKALSEEESCSRWNQIKEQAQKN